MEEAKKRRRQQNKKMWISSVISISSMNRNTINVSGDDETPTANMVPSSSKHGGMTMLYIAEFAGSP